MPTNVIMPALEMAQETGKVVRWLKAAGDSVRKGEPIIEIETDKVTVEIESPASGVLRDVTASEGDVVPVGQTIAVIFSAEEAGVAAKPAVMPAGSAAARRIGEDSTRRRRKSKNRSDGSSVHCRSSRHRSRGRSRASFASSE